MKIKIALSVKVLILFLAGAAEFTLTSGALAAPGDLYVSDATANSIVIYSIGGVQRTFATGLNSPQGLAFDAIGNLYEADAGSGTIFKFTKAGGKSTFATGLLNPIGLVVDGPDLLVAENSGNVVSALPLAGGLKRTSFLVTAPQGLAFDGINRYVANTASVFKVVPDGTMTDIDPGDGSRGVELDQMLNVFVSTDSGTVSKITPLGVKTTFASGLIDPHGMAFRPKRFSTDTNGVGNLYVADTAGGAIFQYLVDGTKTTFATAGNPNYLAFETIIPAKADFNGDGRSDILWQNSSSGARPVWLMNGTTFNSAVTLATVPTVWDIGGTGDFNGDLNADILWQNSVTGQRVIWLMHLTIFNNAVSLGTVATSWNIVGSGDFNGDGMSDILWQNSVTGQRVIWLMSGTTFSSAVSLGIVATSWNIVGSGDFDGDGKPDILWQNSVTGQRVIWLMNGTTFNSAVSLGIVGTEWSIRNY